LLNSINSLNPDDVLSVIQQGLDKWNHNTISDRSINPTNTIIPSHRWEDSYPENGLVLTGYKIDLKSDPPSNDNRGDRWNMDHVWFNKAEMKEWITNDLIEGSVNKVPAVISERLIRFHLVDNVRGQTLPFAPDEIKMNQMMTEVVLKNESSIELEISGESFSVAKGEWSLGENDWTPTHLLDHSIRTKLLGKVTYNFQTETVTEFEMVAIGERSGKTKNNGRMYGSDSNHIGFYYKMAQENASEKIAPPFIDLYNADWIIHPINKKRL
tara:strand:+ start:3380 stop:4186 length:807 start_codon:yes stop_codon:yes gene_type:complete